MSHECHSISIDCRIDRMSNSFLGLKERITSTPDITDSLQEEFTWNQKYSSILIDQIYHLVEYQILH